MHAVGEINEGLWPKSGQVEIRALIELLEDGNTSVVEVNAARRLSALQDNLTAFIKGLCSTI